ncbi:hypothetical protein PHSY_002167 [Pseudozyma hubeiensis SY62]|uniref:Rpr2-domain-containing protein n=1 Tax=Pseudozyma hubeiensis (strain SY62) TaxID=1305764 RepID=R9P0G8_PSEHS|nr:hypothetical protein PHSY_002167 [Pseudozyma hubeiensis SY62]GAC94594.1 hypothetical protein PHSY_002167 [Pseudozyma hubeiensis SY62]
MSRCHSSSVPRRDYRFDSTGVRVPVNAFFWPFEGDWTLARRIWASFFAMQPLGSSCTSIVISITIRQSTSKDRTYVSIAYIDQLLHEHSSVNMTSKQKGKQAQPSTGTHTVGPSSSTSPKSNPTWTAPKTLTHPEHHHTLNHLNQVASYYAVLSTSSSSVAPIDTASRLQAEMVRSAKTLSRKAVIRMDTGLKRDFCIKCDTVLVQGLTASVRSRVSGPHDHVIKARCKVCGTVTRRPAPDLVPRLLTDDPGGKEKGDDGDANVTEEKSECKIPSEREAGEEVRRQEKRKVPQRQRRRTASIKRHILRHTDSDAIDPSDPQNASQGFSMVPSATSVSAMSTTDKDSSAGRPSRRQIAEKRKARIANRATSASAAAPAVNEPRERKKHARMEPLYVLRDSPLPTLAALEDTPPRRPTEDLLRHGTAPSRRQKLPRAPRPQLPHFNDRLHGSHWDDPLTRLSSLLADSASKSPIDTSSTDDHASQALHFWQSAAHSRGDHLLVTGVGKNGALGPTVP